MPKKKSRKLLNEQIEVFILQQIAKGAFVEGDRLPPDRELAQRFKSSQIPVRQATQRLCERGYLKRIQGKGTYVKSVNPGAEKTDRVAVLYWPKNTDFFASSYYAQILSGIEANMNERRKTMVLRSLRRFDGDDPCSAIQDLVDEVDAFLLIDPLPYLLDALKGVIHNCGKPVVIVGYEAVPMHIDSVEIDSYRNAAAMVQFLIDQGHHSIACAYRPSAGDLVHPNIKQRLRAYEDVMLRNQLAIPNCGRLALTCPNKMNDDDKVLSFISPIEIAMGDEEILRHSDIQNHATAIFACADGIAIQLYDVCRKIGLNIPDDMSIVGHDDAAEAKLVSPALTTVSAPLFDMGYAAASQAVQRAGQVTAHQQGAFRLSLAGEVCERASHKSLLPRQVAS